MTHKFSEAFVNYVGQFLYADSKEGWCMEMLNRFSGEVFEDDSLIEDLRGLERRQIPISPDAAFMKPLTTNLQRVDVRQSSWGIGSVSYERVYKQLHINNIRTKYKQFIKK